MRMFQTDAYEDLQDEEKQWKKAIFHLLTLSAFYFHPCQSSRLSISILDNLLDFNYAPSSSICSEELNIIDLCYTARLIGFNNIRSYEIGQS